MLKLKLEKGADMGVNKIGLNVSEIKDIADCIDNFPLATNAYVEITVESNGLGKTTTIEFSTKMNGIDGKFSVEITGSSDW